MRGMFIVASAIALVAVPALAEPGDHDFGFHSDHSPRSDFDRAIDRAPHEARDRDRDAKVDRDTKAAREGLDHEGLRADLSDRASVGVDIGLDHISVNVRADTDPD
jgi:hypothetical protein